MVGVYHHEGRQILVLERRLILQWYNIYSMGLGSRAVNTICVDGFLQVDEQGGQRWTSESE